MPSKLEAKAISCPPRALPPPRWSRRALMYPQLPSVRAPRPTPPPPPPPPPRSRSPTTKIDPPLLSGSSAEIPEIAICEQWSVGICQLTICAQSSKFTRLSFPLLLDKSQLTDPLTPSPPMSHPHVLLTLTRFLPPIASSCLPCPRVRSPSHRIDCLRFPRVRSPSLRIP